MGYRRYIGSLPKHEWNRIKNLTFDELIIYKNSTSEREFSDYIGVHHIPDTELYELGDMDYDNENIGRPIFSNEETNKHFTNEHDFKIVNKEFLAGIINNFQEKVKSFYTDMLVPLKLHSDGDGEFLKSLTRDYDTENSTFNYNYDFTKLTQSETNAIGKMFEHVRSMGIEHGVNKYTPNKKPYDLDRGESVTTSWKYEYCIFELVRIYKNFDWDANIMIFYGW